MYYEPIVEDYEEMKYFTMDHDKKFKKMVGQSKLTALYMKW